MHRLKKIMVCTLFGFFGMNSSALTIPELDKNIDTQNMYSQIVSFPDQLFQAQETCKLIDFSALKNHTFTNIVVAGMGGSAMAGEIALQCVSKELTIPWKVIRDYVLPTSVTAHTLVILASYSGNTAETISCYHDAQKKGATIVGITSGGQLKNLLHNHHHISCTVPTGLQPRAAVGHLSVPFFYILHACNLISPQFKRDLAFTTAYLKTTQNQLASKAHEMAKILHHRMPIIYGFTNHTAIIAQRWRAQFAENSKVLASVHEFPELVHNEIVGWENNSDILKRVCIVWLLGKDLPTQVQRQYAVTRELLTNYPGSQFSVESQQESFITRMFELIHVGDLTSYFLALMYGVDPTPIEKISLIK